jgi:hypothetical protein
VADPSFRTVLCVEVMAVPVAGRGPQVNGVVGLFLALSTVSIILRCYCRALIVKSFGVDDWSAVVAWVCFSYLRIPFECC